MQRRVVFRQFVGPHPWPMSASTGLVHDRAILVGVRGPPSCPSPDRASSCRLAAVLT